MITHKELIETITMRKHAANQVDRDKGSTDQAIFQAWGRVSAFNEVLGLLAQVNSDPVRLEEELKNAKYEVERLQSAYDYEKDQRLQTKQVLEHYKRIATEQEAELEASTAAIESARDILNNI